LLAVQKIKLFQIILLALLIRLGILGALAFNCFCLEALNPCVKAGLPAFATIPDLDIYLTLFANHRGAFIDETISSLLSNETSPALSRRLNPNAQLHDLYAKY